MEINSSERRDTILILDFGGQYCHLIGRRFREQGVYAEIVPYDISSEEMKTFEDYLYIKGIILSGSPSSVSEKNALKCDLGIFDLGVPILGMRL